jgi:glycosyltransferase involved in cell wall biosynthesis
MGKSIGFLAGGVDACALWRFYNPYLNLPQSGYYYHFDPAAVLTHDYVGVQRLGLQQNLNAMKSLRQADMKIIYDLDDFLWNIPDWNPHHEMLKQMAYGYSVCLHHADIVTVSTRQLKRAILKHHRHELVNVATRKEIPIVVCENKIDMRLVAPLQVREDLIVGWAGSNTHSRDFQIVLPSLKRIIEEYPTVKFEFAGWIPPELQGFPNVRFRHWVPVSEYMQRFPRWGWSIALAPLFEHPFNASKSGNKMTEAGAMGIPCLASMEPPYADWVDKSKDRDQLKNLLVAGSDGWYAKLKMLIEDAAARQNYGELMRRNVEQNHSWIGGHSGWDEVFSTLAVL